MPAQAIPMADWPSSVRRKSPSSERHLKNIRQLTFGGQNAEAYWDLTAKKLTFQSRQPGLPDEQIFTMNADGTDRRLLSPGLGRCTCSYFTPDGRYLYFSSTHELNQGAQPPIDMSKGYVWMVNPQFSLFRKDLRTGTLQKVIEREGYVAETTIAPDGSYMTFTANWDGDLDIYRANLDGTGIKRLTEQYGYDGGPFVSWDSKVIVYRRAPALERDEMREYTSLLSQNLVRPKNLDIWVMDAHGRYGRPVTQLGGASFAPFLHPDGNRIIFSSNHHDPKGREFDLFLVGKDGKGLEQVTFTGDFDGFPMFSRDGKKLVWASNRHGNVPGETNVFVADWED